MPQKVYLFLTSRKRSEWPKIFPNCRQTSQKCLIIGWALHEASRIAFEKLGYTFHLRQTPYNIWALTKKNPPTLAHQGQINFFLFWESWPSITTKEELTKLCYICKCQCLSQKKPVSCRDNKVWYEAGYCRYIHR